MTNEKLLLVPELEELAKKPENIERRFLTPEQRRQVAYYVNVKKLKVGIVAKHFGVSRRAVYAIAQEARE